MSCDLSILDFSVGNLHTYTTVSIHWSNDVLVRQNSIILDVRGMFIALTCPHLFFFVMYKIIFFCGQLYYTVGFRLDSRQLFVDCHDHPKNDTRIEANLTLTSHIAWISCPSIPQSMNMWKSYHVRFPFFCIIGFEGKLTGSLLTSFLGNNMVSSICSDQSSHGKRVRFF